MPSFLLFLSLLALFWILLHLLHRPPPPLPTTSHPPRTSLTLSHLSLHLSTTALNDLPPRLLRPFGKRALRNVWDLGAIVGVVGIAGAQLVLVWAAWRGLGTVWKLGGKEEVVRLVKRGLPAEGGESVLRPIIPGVTLPLSAFPLLLLALLLSQSFHELGHALSAASERLPLLRTGLHLHLLLPTFYVLLPSPFPSAPLTDLRISTAGITHNLFLAASFALLSFAPLSAPFYASVEGGVRVVDLRSSSPLKGLLRAGEMVVGLDDVELDEGVPSIVWEEYLRKEGGSAYESMGWCFPREGFSERREGCCSEGEEGRLCFEEEEGRTACVSAEELWGTGERAKRCVRSTGCGEGVCARIEMGEKVVRITVRDGEETRVVVWQGARRGVLEQVSVTGLEPRWWFLPLSLPRTISRFISHTISLSLTLAFFNLLPLPHLDGSAILSSFFASLLAAASPGALLEEGREGGKSEGEGLLGAVVGWSARRCGRIAERGEGVERGLRRVTTGLLVGVVLGSAVELLFA